MANDKANKPGKTAAVKAFLADHPEAETTEIIAGLQAQGIEVSPNDVASVRFRLKKKVNKSPKTKKSGSTMSAKNSQKEGKRTRTPRPYPTDSFGSTLELGRSIFTLAGTKIRRLTLCTKLDRSPTSSSMQTLITNSSKYGITLGSYNADFLELTPDGELCCKPDTPSREMLSAKFRLAIEHIAPFKLLYDQCAGKRLPVVDVLKDILDESNLELVTPDECVDLFIVNIKELGLLQTIAGAETVIPIDAALDELGPEGEVKPPTQLNQNIPANVQSTDWNSICFYITPIGEEGSDARKHSDMFMQSLIEPAMRELGLKVVRSDQIGEPGMISTLVLEHLRLAKLCIADLSMLNPNVFYEMALRHSCKLPIVQLIRKSDRLPFDVNQVKSVTIDLSEMYLFVPKIGTYVAEIKTLARKAIEDPSRVGNPIIVFYPDFWKT